MLIKTQFEPNEDKDLDKLFLENQLIILPVPIDSTIYEITYCKAKDKIWNIDWTMYKFNPYHLKPFLFFDILKYFNITFFGSQEECYEAYTSYCANPNLLLDKLNTKII